MPHAYAGFSMLEILISLLLLTLVIWATNKLFDTAIQESHQNKNLQIATYQMQNIMNELMMHKTVDAKYISNWNAQNHQLLVNGNGVVEQHASHYQILIYWGKHHANECLIENLYF